MNALIADARAQGITQIYDFDFILTGNRAMRECSDRLGFRESRYPEDSSVVVLTKDRAVPAK